MSVFILLAGVAALLMLVNAVCWLRSKKARDFSQGWLSIVFWFLVAVGHIPFVPASLTEWQQGPVYHPSGELFGSAPTQAQVVGCHAEGSEARG